MLEDILLHPKTKLQLDHVVAQATHGVLLSGRQGSGAYGLALQLASLQLSTSLELIASHPYVRIINPSGDVIAIEEIRELQQFLKLRVPGRNKAIERIVVIEQAQRMRHEAQNALLKTLEEPPAGTQLILTSYQPDRLLETIHSRLTQITLLPVSLAQATKFFSNKGFRSSDITKHYPLSQGEVELLTALLSNTEHPLVQAVNQAKAILATKPSERLFQTDSLAKDKAAVHQLLDALGRITHAALHVASTQNKSSAVKQWHTRQAAVVKTQSMLQYNANTKLLLDDLFLKL